MSDPVAIALIAALPATVAAICGLITTIIVARARKVVDKLEKNTNSIREELVRVTGESEHAKGKLEGQAEGKQ